MMNKTPTTSSQSNNPFFAKAGDALHVMTLASTFGFALLAGKYMRDPSSTLFDSQWKEEGFCVTNREVPFWSSHDVCLYVDTVMSMVATGLYLMMRRGTKENKGDTQSPLTARNNGMFLRAIPSFLAHGLGHGFIGKEIREGRANIDERQHGMLAEEVLAMDSPWEGFRRHALPLFIFWIFMSQACLRQASMIYVFLASVLITLRQMWTPNHFGFTYVQSVLFLLSSIDQLHSPAEEKDFGYFLFPLLVSLPVTLVGWLEATTCSSFVRDSLYGHVAYDFYIPLSMMAWYIMVQNRRTLKKVKQL